MPKTGLRGDDGRDRKVDPQALGRLSRRRRLDRARSSQKEVRHLGRAARTQSVSDGGERNRGGRLAFRRLIQAESDFVPCTRPTSRKL